MTKLSLAAGSVRRARPPVCLRQRFLSNPRGRSSSPPIAQPQSKTAEGGCGSWPRPRPPVTHGPAGARPATLGHFRLRERGGGADVRRAGKTSGARLPLPAAWGQASALARLSHDALRRRGVCPRSAPGSRHQFCSEFTTSPGPQSKFKSFFIFIFYFLGKWRS